MEAICTFTSAAMPWPGVNCDTDQIIPARYLQKPRSDNFGDFLFADFRFDAKGTEVGTFVLNEAPYRDARIVVAARNFGCGSSREHAVWALYDYGIRAVVAPSLGDIFFNNSFQNGLLPVVLPAERVAALRVLLEQSPGSRVAVRSQTQGW